MKKVEFTPEQIKTICSLYEDEQLAMKKIGERFNVSRTVIRRVLDEANIEIKKDNHIYKADYRKFKDIDSPQKAYWLGFIAADGNIFIRPENATVSVNQHLKDKAHLEKLKDFMRSNVPIKEYINSTGYSNKEKPTPMCRIAFNSKDMAQDLIKLGIIPAKSLVLEAPKIDEKYFLPYILGYFDGDGTIFKFNNNTEYGIGFTGSYGTITWINEVLQLNAKLEQRQIGSATYYIRCGGTNKPYSILKLLYDSTDVHLDRKYLLFKELESVVLNGNIK